MSRGPRSRPAAQRGMLLIGLLVALALAAGALAVTAAGMAPAEARRRSAEEDLLSIGEQYRVAIESYGRDTPGGIRQWPTKLEDLVNDTRFPTPRHHLRKLFKDPLAPDKDWGPVSLGLAIIGGYSQADGVPFRQSGFFQQQASFAEADTYEKWKFIATTATTLPKSAPLLAPNGMPLPVPRVPGGKMPDNPLSNQPQIAPPPISTRKVIR